MLVGSRPGSVPGPRPRLSADVMMLAVPTRPPRGPSGRSVAQGEGRRRLHLWPREAELQQADAEGVKEGPRVGLVSSPSYRHRNRARQPVQNPIKGTPFPFLRKSPAFCTLHRRFLVTSFGALLSVSEHPRPSSEPSDPWTGYLDSLAELEHDTEASEASYYLALAHFLERMGASRRISVLLQPRPDDNGAPDLRVTRGGHRVVGYVEVKRPGADLEKVSKSEQLRRYLDGYPNLLLTDTCEFRLFRNKREILHARLVQPWLQKNLDRAFSDAVIEELRELLAVFFSFNAPPTRSARRLAGGLARMAKLLCRYTALVLKRDETAKTRDLHLLQQATYKALLRNLPPDRFADLYAQTVTYGLFAARYWASDEQAAHFTRKTAYDAIPESLGLIRLLFRWVLFTEPPEEIRWIVDDLAETLAATDVRGIFSAYFEDGEGNDPVVHFYETFLAQYDPDRRERRGVFYTPEAVVSYIVRSADAILRRDFDLEEGLAHPRVTVLDPAAGTLTFSVEAMRQACTRFREIHGPAAGGASFRDEMLDRFYAFELMVAPYVIGHLRAAMLFEEMGCKLESHQSFHLLLANALQMEPPEQLGDEHMKLLASDALAALEIMKRPMDLPVILGNPPYSGHSANRSPWIERSLRHGYERPNGPADDGYYTVAGVPLGEKNPKWLQDDYVKFLRFAQWKVDQAGQGAVAFVTNHSYLDNPTFRGLRESLLGTFDRLYLLDLHGNSKKKEQPPDGGPDQNVFEIQQGVAIALLVKRPGLAPGVFRGDCWGTEKDKTQWLLDHDVTSTSWQSIEARPPGYYFVPRDAEIEDRWRHFPAVDDIFEVGSLGVITGRDRLVLDLDRQKLRHRLSLFRAPPAPHALEVLAGDLGLRSTKTWDLETAQREAHGDPYLVQRIERFLFRPFDRRWIAYAPYLLERPRAEVMHHLGGENPIRRRGLRRTPDNCALLVTRQAKRHPGAFVTRDLTGHKVLDTYDGNYAFPLYLLPPENLLHPEDQRVPNLRHQFVEWLEALYQRPIEPESLFGYLYAILASERYRTTYRAMLVTGFPRIPFPSSVALFDRLAALGCELVRLHLPDPRNLSTVVTLQGEDRGAIRIGGTATTFPRLHETDQKLDLNGSRHYLTPVTRDMWEYRIGSYPVLAQWLDARRGNTLATDDIRHLCRTAGAIRASLDRHRDIDALYPEIEQDLTPPVRFEVLPR